MIVCLVQVAYQSIRCRAEVAELLPIMHKFHNDMKSKIDPGLYFVLYDGVANYINNNEKSSPNNILENATEQQRKRQRDRTNTDLTSFSLLINEQQAIGWDNLLRGKLSVQWRELQRRYEITQRSEQNQRKVRTKLKLGNVSNPYDDDKAKKEKKKKKEKDIFQALIEKKFRDMSRGTVATAKS